MSAFGVTEIENYLRCRRRWHLSSRNRENLERLVPAFTALPLGTIIHESLSQWLTRWQEHEQRAQVANLGNTLMPDLPSIYHVAAVTENQAIVDRYKTRVGAAISQAELQPLHDDLVMGAAMMENYQEFWKRPLPEEFELVSPEQRVTVAIPGTEHAMEWRWLTNDSTPIEAHDWNVLAVEQHEFGSLFHVRLSEPVFHYLEGRLDAIVRDRKRGLYYVLEHKTYGQRPRETVLRSNHQFLAYHWLLLQVADGVGIDKVGGILYDGMYKRAVPPKGLQVRDLFTRLRIERPPEELAEFEYMLRAIAIEMGNNPPIYIHRMWDGSCDWGCSMNHLCTAMSKGEDTAHTRRTEYTLRPTDTAGGEAEPAEHTTARAS